MINEKVKIIGKSMPIMEARDKVTGRSKFVDDLAPELFVKILGSPHAHAMIRSIDIERAKNLKGVEAILTHRDVPRRLMPSSSHRSCYAMDEHLRHVGDYVAAVAATSERVAEEALSLIDVDYEVLPCVFDPEEAMKAEAPRLYPEGNVYGSSQANIMERGAHEPCLQEWGDVRKGFDEADVIVEDQFEVISQIHAAIEPRVTMACWEKEGLTIWSSTQTPWSLREAAAHVFEMPESKIIVLTPNVGGGFGGKYTGRYQLITCLLSKVAGGKRTKLTLTREEDQCYTRRPRSKLHVKIGAKKDGKITAIELVGYIDIGAYGHYRNTTVSSPLEPVVLSYNTENARFESWGVHTNHFRSEAMRSVSAPHLAFALESIVDEVAEKLGLDPIDIRLWNMPVAGDMMPPSPYIQNSGGCVRAKLDLYPGEEMIRQATEKVDWKKKWKGFGKAIQVNGPKRRGIGLAYCMEYCGYLNDGATSIQIVINRDGSAIIHSGAQEIGQGINTTLRMLTAESLGISLEDVAIVSADTRTGQCDMTNARASHQLATDGHLLLKAIDKAKQRIREIVSPAMIGSALKVKSEEIEIRGKHAYIKGHPETAKPLKELLSAPITISSSGPTGSRFPEVKPGYKDRQPAVLVAEVEVDMETGEVTPIKVVAGMFPGKMINPGVVRGQCIGGAVQAIGMALWEELKFDDRSLAYLSRNFTDYRIPRALDIPEMDTVLLEEIDETSLPHEGLPYGGRGIGEISGWGGPAVMANAIYNAIGVRIKRSPMTAEVILEALRKGSTE
ncbi:MAG: xanthine dehydrogenase family protein molybdopterin-binding subunit [Deltaproteobacteria bacterium]